VSPYDGTVRARNRSGIAANRERRVSVRMARLYPKGG